MAKDVELDVSESVFDKWGIKDTRELGKKYRDEFKDVLKANNGVDVRKVWTFEIEFINARGKRDTLYGVLTAAGAGSVQEPLSKYDVTAYVS